LIFGLALKNELDAKINLNFQSLARQPSLHLMISVYAAWWTRTSRRLHKTNKTCSLFRQVLPAALFIPSSLISFFYLLDA